MERKINGKIKFTTFNIIIIGFIIVIIAGTILLMLPLSSRTRTFTPFLDALFTATSATCVTGLVLHDTATYWSAFGQFVILMLIQTGGMGVVTLSICVTRLSGRKIGLIQRSTMQESIAAPAVGGIVRMTSFIIKGIILFEVAGSVIMMPVFIKDFGILKGLWYSIFHSVSAFCNAGFDLMGRPGNGYASLTGYSSNAIINITIIMLILIGGIGFTTWNDIVTNKNVLKKYRLQTKIILVTTVVLVVIPALYYYFGEFESGRWGNMSEKDKILASLFQTVTPRTAGFNTVDLTKISEAGITIMILLMLIGGAPGSTAGGMKLTTVAILFTNMITVFKRKGDIECYGRRIEDSVVKSAATLIMMYASLCIGGAVIISIVEKLPMLACIFETASAVATVGLTLGITPGLGIVSKIVLIILMYIGRVGGLTLIFATVSESVKKGSKYPKEKVTVG